MPGIGGKEVATYAKARYPHMPVGLVTGWTGDFLSPNELGGPNVDFVVPKPYRIQSIRDAVSRACARPPLDSEPVLAR
jgi:FixJ family two-component response regulator